MRSPWGRRCPHTASTLTGFQTARQHFGKQRVHIGYFPYDCILAVRMAFAKIRPTRVIITETDIWPTFLWEMQRRRVPVDMVNLRISDRTWKNYRRFRWLAGSLYAHFERVCVQTATEKRRLIKLGVSEDRIRITGSLKFDAAAASGSAKQLPMPFDDLCLPRGHRVIVAGSTHEGEEEMLCEALKPILFKDPGITLMVVPRDPERSAAIQSVCRQHGLKVQRFSRMAAMQGKIYPQVVVVDAIGLLKDLYRMAYFAIIGGSLAPYGGHNPLEPAFWGKPILFGKDMQDFALIAEYLLTGGAALQVNDVDALQAVVVHLLKQPDTVQRMGQRALKVVNDHRGAVHRTLSHLELAA
ncbi:MAG: glycosyltransferase N-terminal domain-containing protein [Desulfobacteraceae bacterium]